MPVASEVRATCPRLLHSNATAEHRTNPQPVNCIRLMPWPVCRYANQQQAAESTHTDYATSVTNCTSDAISQFCHLLRPVYSDTTQLNSTSSCRYIHSMNNCHRSVLNVVEGVYSDATQLNSTSS